MTRCLYLPPVVALSRLLARMPQRVLLWTASVVSFLLWPVLARRRRIARINIDLCFPGLSANERRRLLRANQRETVMGMFELMRAWFAPARKLLAVADIEGLDRLREALARGRGVLLFTGHFTHTELAVRLLSEALGQPVRTVVRRHNHPCIEREFERARSRVFGATLAKKDTRGLLRALQSGEVVVYSADQDFSYQNEFVPFFGIAAATLVSTPELVRRAGAEMMPFWFHRVADGRYRLFIQPRWPDWSEGDAATAAAIYMRELETEVRKYPEQYLWVHRRFKTRPPGEPTYY